jgi:HTH-type transcriptional regulator / antitoxin HipB
LLVSWIYDSNWYLAMTRNTQSLKTASQLGQLLRSARKAGKVTQSQLALRLGVSQSRVSQLELQPGDMTVDQLLSACAALGLELQLGQRQAGMTGEVLASETVATASTRSASTSRTSSAKSVAASVLSQRPGSSSRPPLSSKAAASLAAKNLASKPRKGTW